MNEIFPIVPYVHAKMAGIMNKAYCVHCSREEKINNKMGTGEPTSLSWAKEI